jgi:hypothetical protein
MADAPSFPSTEVAVIASPIVIVALVLFAEPQVAPAFRTSNSAFGKTFVTEVTIATLEAAPSWNDEADENPPVSAKGALRLARDGRDSVIVIPDEFEWDRGSLMLIAAPHWVWVVNFKASHKRGLDPSKHRLTLLVLMNGTVVKPALKDGAE